MLVSLFWSIAYCTKFCALANYTFSLHSFLQQKKLQDDLQASGKAQRSGTISRLTFLTIGDVSVQFIIVSLK